MWVNTWQNENKVDGLYVECFFWGGFFPPSIVSKAINTAPQFLASLQSLVHGLAFITAANTVFKGACYSLYYLFILYICVFLPRQVLNQTSRLEIQLLENSLSTNKLEKELMVQTNEISKLHDKNR